MTPLTNVSQSDNSHAEKSTLFLSSKAHWGLCVDRRASSGVMQPRSSRRACVSHKAQKTHQVHLRVRALSRKRFSVGDLPPQRQNSSSYVTPSQSFQPCSSRGLTTSLNGIALEISEQARPPNHTLAPLAVSGFPSPFAGPPSP